MNASNSIINYNRKRRKRAEGLLNINWPIDTQIPILPMPMPPIPSEDG